MSHNYYSDACDCPGCRPELTPGRALTPEEERGWEECAFSNASSSPEREGGAGSRGVDGETDERIVHLDDQPCCSGYSLPPALPPCSCPVDSFGVPECKGSSLDLPVIRSDPRSGCSGKSRLNLCSNYSTKTFESFILESQLRTSRKRKYRSEDEGASDCGGNNSVDNGRSTPGARGDDDDDVKSFKNSSLSSRFGDDFLEEVQADAEAGSNVVVDTSETLKSPPILRSPRINRHHRFWYDKMRNFPGYVFGDDLSLDKDVGSRFGVAASEYSDDNNNNDPDVDRASLCPFARRGSSPSLSSTSLLDDPDDFENLNVQPKEGASNDVPTSSGNVSSVRRRRRRRSRSGASSVKPCTSGRKSKKTRKRLRRSPSPLSSVSSFWLPHERFIRERPRRHHSARRRKPLPSDSSDSSDSSRGITPRGSRSSASSTSTLVSSSQSYHRNRNVPLRASRSSTITRYSSMRTPSPILSSLQSQPTTSMMNDADLDDLSDPAEVGPPPSLNDKECSEPEGGQRRAVESAAVGEAGAPNDFESPESPDENRLDLGVGLAEEVLIEAEPAGRRRNFPPKTSGTGANDSPDSPDPSDPWSGVKKTWKGLETSPESPPEIKIPAPKCDPEWEDFLDWRSPDFYGMDYKAAEVWFPELVKQRKDIQRKSRAHACSQRCYEARHVNRSKSAGNLAYDQFINKERRGHFSHWYPPIKSSSSGKNWRRRRARSLPRLSQRNYLKRRHVEFMYSAFYKSRAVAYPWIGSLWITRLLYNPDREDVLARQDVTTEIGLPRFAISAGALLFPPTHLGKPKNYYRVQTPLKDRAKYWSRWLWKKWRSKDDCSFESLEKRLMQISEELLKFCRSENERSCGRCGPSFKHGPAYTFHSYRKSVLFFCYLIRNNLKSTMKARKLCILGWHRSVWGIFLPSEVPSRESLISRLANYSPTPPNYHLRSGKSLRKLYSKSRPFRSYMRRLARKDMALYNKITDKIRSATRSKISTNPYKAELQSRKFNVDSDHESFRTQFVASQLDNRGAGSGSESD